MKGYKGPIVVFSILLVLYIITELNKPVPIDWTVTISRSHKTPFGGYIVSDRLHDIFPNSSIRSYRTPVYQQLNNYSDSNTAYLLMGDEFSPSRSDVDELLNYVLDGNFAFLAYDRFSNSFLDSLDLKTSSSFSMSKTDSSAVRLVNPSLAGKDRYKFPRTNISGYFTRFDTANTVVLGVNDRDDANFIKVPYGAGAFFIHTNPVCFSNYFLLHRHNARYAAAALSYIPADVQTIFWDEYYKLGRTGADTPLRFLLSNEHLRWALRIALAGMLLYILFQMKRRQRIIPVIEPLKNASLDFARTVAGVYYHARDNSGIATQKITYWQEFVRHRFNLSTHSLDEDFVEQLSRKSGIEKEVISRLVSSVAQCNGRPLSDEQLLQLNNQIDQFYKQV